LKLPPATTLQWRAGQLSGPCSYWTPYDQPPETGRSWREDQERLLELLRDAVRARMISDVPLGVMLSGGLDSSLIAALMTEVSGRVSTFSIGFREDADANELTWARRTATRLGADHHELVTSVSDHDDLLDEALWHLEEPIADLSFLGFLLLSRLARETVTVALCGQAADELLAGYTKHRAARVSDIAARAPTLLRGALARGLLATDERARFRRLAEAISSDDDIDRLLWMSRVVTPALRQEVRGPLLPECDPRDLLRSSIAAAVGAIPPGSRLQHTLGFDLRLALPDLMFLYFDKMSMAASLEVRVPFADHELVSFCMALPDDRRIRRLRGKEILRRVSKGLVDDAIITRPKRGFFRSASASWLGHRQDSVREVLLSERCRSRGVLNPAVLSRWVERSDQSGRSGEPLLSAYLLERWHQIFVDADGLAHQRVRAARPTSDQGSAPPVT
jgi:asparagine synthase (glutamine-hydrolysing)